MNLKIKKRIVLLIIFTMLPFATGLKAWYYDSIDKAGFQGFNGEGSFVENPAYVGSSLGYFIMTSPPFFPAQVLSEPTRLIYRNDTQNISDYIGAYTMIGSAKFFGILFGGPSYGLKKAFWDLPGYAINGRWPDNTPKQPDIVVNPKLLGEHDIVVTQHPPAAKTETVVTQPAEDSRSLQIKTIVPPQISETPAVPSAPADKHESTPPPAPVAAQPAAPQAAAPAPTENVNPFGEQSSSWSTPSVSSMMKNTQTDSK